jgi:hypothetical protein
VRTTISISDALLEKAKRLAQREGRTLGELVESALQERLSRESTRAAKAPPFRLHSFGEGGLQAGLSFERLKELTDTEEAERLPSRPASRAADGDDPSRR